MAIVYNNGATTLTINGRALKNLMTGDVITVAFKNPKTSRANSATGVSISERSDGGECAVTVRVEKNSDDDVFLSSLGAPISATLVTKFKKDNTDGSSSYRFENGSITTQPTNTFNNQEVNALMEYVVEFRDAVRV